MDPKPLPTRYRPERNRINMDKPLEVKSWARQLGVSTEKLQLVVEKVGCSATAVRKELASQ
jgi:hypothetical protein